jgi:hypothetical protein
LLGGSFRRALRAEALRRDELPRTPAPAPAAAGPRRHAPMPRQHEQGQGQAIAIAPSAPIAARKVTATGTERRAGLPLDVVVTVHRRPERELVAHVSIPPDA